jgi:c-di-AMP phosphodiesterase-like protein
MISPIQSVTLTPDLYDSDYSRWIEATIEALKSRQLSTLDIDNLIEELEGMNRSDRRAIDSLLTRLFEHFIRTDLKQ